MLKIKDKNGKTMAVLKDDDSEPDILEEKHPCKKEGGCQCSTHNSKEDKQNSNEESESETSNQ